MRLFEIKFLDRTWLGASYQNYLWFLALVLIALLLKKPFARLIASITSLLAVKFSGGKYRGLFKSLIRKPIEWLFAIVLMFLGFNYISAPLNKLTLLSLKRDKGISKISLADLLDHAFLFFGIVFVALTVTRLVDFFYRTEMEKAHHADQKERSQILPLLKEVMKFLAWTIAFFWALGVVFQVNIPALIAGLGIGGVALALAAKESVENLFASLTILSDKPFLVGDTIKVGGLEGKVERIGFRSARLRGADGSLYVIPNKKLVDENLENLTQRDTRGVKVVLNIKYGIPQKQLQQMIDELKGMVQKTLHVIAPVKVSLEAFNEKAFQIVISYHLPEPIIAGNEYDVKQAINIMAYDIVMKYTPVIGTPSIPTVDDDD